MKSSDPVLVRGTNFGLLSALLLPGLLIVGCVSLTKPLAVQKCSSSSAGCSDDPNQVRAGDDAKKDINDDTVDSSSPDLTVGDDKPVVQPDAGSDLPASEPDSPVDKGDSATVTPDTKDTTSGDARDSLDVFDAVTPPSDGPEDKVPGPEPGPEPAGAEPSSGPEPGPEPGREPGLEPGPEPGPERGPEPPRDGGTDGSTAACANATPVSGGQIAFNTTSAFCFVTCDTIQNGWGCDSFTEAKRTVTVNGTSVTCSGTLPAKKSGYYYFAIAAGGEIWDAIHWSGTAATSCPPPAGGFSP